MEHRQKMEELNSESLEKLEAFMRSNEHKEHKEHDKINTAKEKWQSAWNEFLQTLIVLEKLEI